MDTLLLVYGKLKEIALFPWFAIADTQISLLSICGLVIILAIVWRIGIAFEQAIIRIGSNQGKKFSPGWYAVIRGAICVMGKVTETNLRYTRVNTIGLIDVICGRLRMN